MRREPAARCETRSYFVRSQGPKWCNHTPWHARSFLQLTSQASTYPPFNQSHQKMFTRVRLTSRGRASGSRTPNLGSCLQKPAAAPMVKTKLLLPVLEEATKPKGDKLENRLQDKDNGEDVIANLQGFIKNLGCGHKTGVRC